MLRKPLLLTFCALLVSCFSFSASTLGGAEDPPLRNPQLGRSEDAPLHNPPVHDARQHLLGKDAGTVYASLTAHEWGTFTSIAGNDGEAVEWSPLTRSTDLPGFVEHFLDPGFRLGLRGTVGMERPGLALEGS